MLYKAGQVEVSLEVASCQFSSSQAPFMAAKAECDQNRGFFGAEAQTTQDLEAILPEVLQRFDDCSSFLILPFEMFRHDTNCA